MRVGLLLPSAMRKALGDLLALHDDLVLVSAERERGRYGVRGWRAASLTVRYQRYGPTYAVVTERVLPDGRIEAAA